MDARVILEQADIIPQTDRKGKKEKCFRQILQLVRTGRT